MSLSSEAGTSLSLKVRIDGPLRRYSSGSVRTSDPYANNYSSICEPSPDTAKPASDPPRSGSPRVVKGFGYNARVPTFGSLSRALIP